MARKQQRKLREEDLQGFKYFKILGPLLESLHKVGTQRDRAGNRQLSFDQYCTLVLRGIPIKVMLTEGNGNEKHQLRGMLEPGRLYVIDRGYVDYPLFQDILDGGSSFIGRIRAGAVWTVIEERPVSAKAKAAGVRRDLVVRLGCDKSKAVLKQPLRVDQYLPRSACPAPPALTGYVHPSSPLLVPTTKTSARAYCPHPPIRQ